jgi:hypothetical protein
MNMIKINSDHVCHSNDIQSDRLTSDNKITFQVYNDFQSMYSMRSDWDDFIESLGGEIFLTFDWCQTWWKYYGTKRELSIFVFRNGSEICGILPLFREKIWLGPLSIIVIKMVSSDFMPVTMTVPIREKYIDQVVDLLIEEIHAKWRWHLLHLGAICGKYNSLKTLIDAFKKETINKYACSLKTEDVQTYFTIADNWESQVAGLTSKQRTNVRRTFRETSGKGIEIGSSLASEETLSQMFDNFVQMHQKHWQGIGMAGHFVAWPDAKEFHHEIAKIQYGYNRLRLIEIKFNDTPVGYEYIYRFGDEYCWFLNARVDFESNSRIDYKWIAFHAKVENALKDNVKTIDAMRGMYDYKLLMGGKIMPINNIFVYPADYPSKSRVFIFRLLAKYISIFYYKIWRLRLAPRLNVRLQPFWKKWVRFHPLAS